MHLSGDKVSHRELSGKTGEKYSLSADISEALGLQNVSVRHEIIPAGRRASRSHTHTHKEEMIFVLEGTPTAVLNGTETVCSVGDSFGFKPGESNYHYVENRTQSVARVLVISSLNVNDRAVYQDTQ